MRPDAATVFVLDTNVILHDSKCIYHFKDNDVVIPITVLEELDRFKKGNEAINFHAREFTRAIDALSEGSLFDPGVRIGEGLGNISVAMEREFHNDLSFAFIQNKPDHLILNCAYHLMKDHPEKNIVFVTKDVNLRMKAKSVGLTADDYTNDHVKNIDALYKGLRREEHVPEELINRLYADPYEVDASENPFEKAMTANEFLILRNERKSGLGVYDSDSHSIKRVDRPRAFGIAPRNAEQTFSLHALMDPNIRLVSITGKAGTGKTLLALAAALQSIDHYRYIYVGRPIVPLSNKDIGFLPGDINSKIGPYMQPLYDNLGVIQNQFSENSPQSTIIRELQESKRLIMTPLSYIRGRSLVDTYFIVDESQNLTPHEVKTIITRAGDNTKMIFTGDIFQIDHPYLNTHSNGLTHLIGKMRGQPLYAHINLEKGERSELAELASNLL
jgi:PhoH-like ATPase